MDWAKTPGRRVEKHLIWGYGAYTGDLTFHGVTMYAYARWRWGACACNAHRVRICNQCHISGVYCCSTTPSGIYLTFSPPINVHRPCWSETAVINHPLCSTLGWRHGSITWQRNIILRKISKPLRWRHNDHAGVSNHQPHGCLLNRLFRRKSKKTSKLRVTGLGAGNSPGTGEFPAQMASYAENVSIWWRHHAVWIYGECWMSVDDDTTGFPVISYNISDMRRTKSYNFLQRFSPICVGKSVTIIMT